jgi:hypothetical protein
MDDRRIFRGVLKCFNNDVPHGLAQGAAIGYRLSIATEDIDLSVPLEDLELAFLKFFVAQGEN